MHHITQYLLAADGTNQLQRNVPALAGDFVAFDERDEKQLLEFLHALATQIRYFDTGNQPAGDWRPFLIYFTENGGIRTRALLREMEENRSNWPPHAALLWAFIKLFRIAQADMNTLTEKHLRYYCEQVLRMSAKKAAPDQVHVIFIPARNASSVLLKRDQVINAGVFGDDTPRKYRLDHDIVVTQAVVDRIMSLYVDRDKSGRKILFTATDATRIRLGTSPSWRPFGISQLNTALDDRRMNATHVGFAIASPALLLAEGDRTIHLSLSLVSDTPVTPRLLTNAVDVSLTTSEGWTEPSGMTARIVPDGTLQVSITFADALPSIVGFDASMHGSAHHTQWPVLRCRLRPQAYMLEELERYRVSSVKIAVAATGVRNLILQNDQSVQSPDKPIFPFTSQPVLGSRFYLGSEEVFQKTLTSLSVKLEWQDPPADFQAHYGVYGNGGLPLQGMNNSSTFTARLHVLAGRQWVDIGAPKATLFNVDTSEPKIVTDGNAGITSILTASGYRRIPGLSAMHQYNVQLRQGFMSLELIEPVRTNFPNTSPDAPFEAFGHKAFPVIYARQAMELARFNGVGTPPVLPKPPYTPVLKSAILNYTAVEEFVPSYNNGIDEYYIEDVFGPYRVGRDEPARLIPELHGNAALYVGLKSARAPQGVSLLFQIDEGTAPGDTLIGKEDLEWSYLTANGWRRVETQQLIEDSTRALQKPGLIRLNMGADAIENATQMPGGWHWLRLVALRHPDGAGSVHDLRAQGARATLQSRARDQSKYSPLLIPHSVIGLERRNSGIRKVEQPYPSFGGRLAEDTLMFGRHVSERIRHRNRAVTTWDYERLILDRFPDIFKVKCIPHTNAQNRIVPGVVRAVVVPDWKRRNTGNPLQPAANASFLKEIEETIQSTLVTPFVRFHIVNPEYETLLVDTHVSFHPEFDPGFYAELLEEEIRRFLSPWAYEEGRDIQFGGKVYRSEILAFVEGRPYVDFVIDFQLYHRHHSGATGGIGQMVIGQDFQIGVSPPPTIDFTQIGEDFIVGEPVEVAAATRVDSILVSNVQHRIRVLPGSGVCTGVLQAGIGQMVVGIDFVPVS